MKNFYFPKPKNPLSTFFTLNDVERGVNSIVLSFIWGLLCKGLDSSMVGVANFETSSNFFFLDS